ncbi:hypothetical protein [Labedaea rhizosphaerae]|uniref:hypothetical protein n=1 Tax=Labedaea rhizosphaerae TaxID=598644 RepID=UPI0010611D22|nr:hypothetical protein [Labedaea rhizosphaerae]
MIAPAVVFAAAADVVGAVDEVDGVDVIGGAEDIEAAEDAEDVDGWVEAGVPAVWSSPGPQAATVRAALATMDNKTRRYIGDPL